MTHCLSDAAQRLLVAEQLHSIADLLARPSPVPSEPGIYGWWFDDCLPQVPVEGTLERADRRLLYVGIAPSRPSGGRTLRQRLRNHCRGPIGSSTLRRTLACLLERQLDLKLSRRHDGRLCMGRDDEHRLTDWLEVYARVSWVIDPNPWEREQELLGCEVRFPLNIQGVNTEFAAYLTELRAAAGRVQHPQG